MGFFTRLNESLNQEFVIGEHNIQRVLDHPEALQEVLDAQRSRGFGPAQKLKQHARDVRQHEQTLQQERRRGQLRVGASVKAPHWFRRTFIPVAKFTTAAVLGLLAGAWWAEREKKNEGGTGGIFW